MFNLLRRAFYAYKLRQLEKLGVFEPYRHFGA